jgi:AraC family transcriptional regulator
MTIADELPSRLLTSSEQSGWRRVEARQYADPPVTEAFRTSTSRLLLVLVTSGRYRIESRQGARWRRVSYRPGSIGVTAPGNISELRWRSTDPSPMQSLHLRLDPDLAGDAVLPDALVLHDPFVSAASWALAGALQEQAPALYADSLAQALVTHLAHRAGRPATSNPRRTGTLGAAQVEQVSEYMRAHLGEDISVDDLAGVANVSKFHFIRTFSQATGLTPYRYLRRMRLRAGAELLRSSSLSVAQIASQCGYLSIGQFAAAFRSEYGVRPSDLRLPQ